MGKQKEFFIQSEKIALLTSRNIGEKGSRKRTRNGPQKTTTIPGVSCPGRTEENDGYGSHASSGLKEVTSFFCYLGTCAEKLSLLSFLFMHKIGGEVCCHFYWDIFSLVPGTCQRESEKYKVNQYWRVKRQRETKRLERHVMITVLAVSMCHQLHVTYKLENLCG